MTILAQLDTPSLILDEEKLNRNIARAKEKCRELGLSWRPHQKTHKCIEIMRRQVANPTGPITVSTIKEAEVFAAAGVTDILYAVGIAPHKLPRLARLNAKGAHVMIILDSVEAAQAVSRFCLETRSVFDVLLEIDCDGHRSGLAEGDPAILQTVQSLTDGAHFKGLLTHAGDSYSESTPQGLLHCAENEALTVTRIADVLAKAGYPCQIVSVGSTPTLVAAEHAYGVTEFRSGVGTFFDLFMAGVGACSIDDIALSVMVSVIGRQAKKGWIITDGGWLAMSRDRGTANQKKDWGYGLVCDEAGRPLRDYYVSGANQEHGIISRFDKAPIDPAQFPLGRRLRILPNHACPTAAAFDKYALVRGTSPDVVAVWPRFNNW